MTSVPQKRNPNEESIDIPDYLNIARGKYYKRSQSAHRAIQERSKRGFPGLKYGLSPDVPAEFQTTYSTQMKERTTKLHNDPTVKGELRKEVLTKEQITKWPMRSIQTADINMASVPHKVETKPVKPKEIYNCIMDTKKVVQRPDIVKHEETLYTKRFYEALKEQKPFNRKSGYLNLFARHHKTTNEEYKIKRSNSNDHSRYQSKPVLFTSLNCKNDMSSHTLENHSRVLLSSIRDKTSNVSQPKTLDNTILAHPTQESETNRTSVKPKPVEERHSYEPSSRFSVGLEKSHNSEQPKAPAGIPPRTAIDFHARRHSQGSMGGPVRLPVISASDSNNHQPSIGRLSETTMNKSNVMDVTIIPKTKNGVTFDVSRGRVAHVVPEIVRFKTKYVASAISSTREDAIKHDPQLLEMRTQDVDNQRECNIQASVAETLRRHAKAHNGSPVRYLSAPPARPTNSQTNLLNDNISKFERHIDGLRKTQAQFGRQRWFYQRDWKINFANEKN